MQLYLFIFAVALTRLVPHPPNFACIGALALFAGFTARSSLGFAAPLLALLASDLLGHFLEVPGMGFYGPVGMLFVYGGFAMVAFIGRYAVQQTSRQTNRSGVMAWLAASSLAGASAFFLLSNFGVFAGGSYGYSWAGLSRCYLNAIPFFSNTLAGDLFFGFVLFGGAWAFGKVNRTGLTGTDSTELVKLAE